MRTTPWHPKRNGREAKGERFCVHCHKPLRGPARVIHPIDGGRVLLHPADEALYVADGGDLGAHPVGPDCARRIGLEWSSPETA